MDVKLKRVAPDSAHTADAPENHAALFAFVDRETNGPVELWTDDNVTAIQLGGGASQGTFRIGGAGGQTVLNDEITIEELKISRVGDLTIGTPFGLTLEALGESFELNTDADQVFDSELTAPSLVGAINELLTRPATALTVRLLNGNAGSLLAGTPVYVTSAGLFDQASAAADTDPANFLGLLRETTVSGAEGEIVTDGQGFGLFGPGEGVGPHGSAEVYLTVGGLCSLTPPNGSGEVVVLIGYVVDTLAYDNVTGGVMLIEVVHEGKRVIS